MPQAELRVFGSFDFRIDKILIPGLRTAKAEALLLYIAIESVSQPVRAYQRRTLASLLWPDIGDKYALANLRTTLYYLRQALDKAQADLSGTLLHITRRQIAFDAEGVHIDLAEFEALLRAVNHHNHEQLPTCDECLDRMNRALSLYRGELLAGFSLPDAPEFEEWLLLRREICHQQAVGVARRLSEAYETRREPGGARQWAQRLVEWDPYRENNHCLLMRIYARQGDVQRALAHYQTLRQILQDEFNTQPGPQTQELIRQIAAGAYEPSVEQLPAQSLPTAPDRTAPDHVEPSTAAEPPSIPSHPHTTQPHTTQPDTTLDLSEVPEVGPFVGRRQERQKIIQWLLSDHCRTVAILGMGGVGKTSLAAHCVREMANMEGQAPFDLVLWRSLINAPPLADLLPPLLQLLSQQQLNNPPEQIDEQIRLLLSYLRERQILLVLDNLESILEPMQAGVYRTGYEPYGQLIEQMATLPHRSQLLLTSRERPSGYARLERDSPLVQALQLTGLDAGAGHELLVQRGLAGGGDAVGMLIERYSGNPLALKLVADTVDELFDGDLREFLADDTLFFDDIRTVLEQHFERCTEMEQQILFWLAVEREPISAQILRGNLLHTPRQRDFLEALRSLQRRSLVEQQGREFSLQNVVTEFLTEQLVEMMSAEIERGELYRMRHHALLKAQAKEYVRESQMRLILAPIGHRLTERLGVSGLHMRLQQILAALRAAAPRSPHYAGGNLLNLLLSLDMDVTGYDFSRLSIWQVNLQSATLRDVNFSEVDFANVLFVDTFDNVNSIAMHTEQQLLASAAAGDMPIRLWRLSDGQLMAVLAGHARNSGSVDFHPRGHLLASGSDDQTIRLWDVSSGRSIRTLRGPHGRLLRVCFSPDGSVLASRCNKDLVCLWSVETGQLLTTLPPHERGSPGLAFHPGGQVLATASANTISLWDIGAVQPQADPSADGVQRLSTLPEEGGWATFDVAFSPDGALLARAGGDSKISLWHIESQTRLRRLAGHAGVVTRIAFSPDGRTLASGSRDGTVRLWDVSTGKLLDVLRGHMGEVISIAMGANGNTVASGGNDGMIRLWNLETSGQRRVLRTFQGSLGRLEGVSFSSRGILPKGVILAAGGGKGWCHIWHVDVAPQPESAQPESAQLESVENDLEQRPKPVCAVYQVALQGHKGAIRAVEFRPAAAQVATASDDQTVRIWDAVTGQCLFVLRDHTSSIQFLAFDEQGRKFASGSDNGVLKLWTIDDWGHYQLHQTLQTTQIRLTAMAMSPNGKTLATNSADRKVRLWDFETGACLQTMDFPQAHARTLHFDPRSERLMIAQTNGCIHIGKIVDRKVIASMHCFHHGQSPINGVAFSPSGHLAVSGGSDPRLFIWDTATGEARHALAGFTQGIQDVAFWPEQDLLAVTGRDGMIRLVDADSGTLLYTFKPPGPYEGMNITGVTGLSTAQQEALKALGAVEFDAELYSISYR